MPNVIPHNIVELVSVVYDCTRHTHNKRAISADWSDFLIIRVRGSTLQISKYIIMYRARW